MSDEHSEVSQRTCVREPTSHRGASTLFLSKGQRRLLLCKFILHPRLAVFVNRADHLVLCSTSTSKCPCPVAFQNTRGYNMLQASCSPGFSSLQPFCRFRRMEVVNVAVCCTAFTMLCLCALVFGILRHFLTHF